MRQRCSGSCENALDCCGFATIFAAVAEQNGIFVAYCPHYNGNGKKANGFVLA